MSMAAKRVISLLSDEEEQDPPQDHQQQQGHINEHRRLGRPRKHPKRVHYSVLSEGISSHSATTLYFEVEGQPQPKARAAPSRRGVFYNPSKFLETEFGAVYKAVFQDSLPPCTGVHFCKKKLLRVNLQFLFAESTPVLRTPDIDNLSKLVLDALNRVAYEDDRQVVALSASKMVASGLSVGRTIVEITETESL
jgi:Holliday junction resolvase RusA-like endonuclease